MDFKEYIIDVQDFPVKGVVFKDLTPLLADPFAFKSAIDALLECDILKNTKVDKVLSPESRGFIIGSVLAYKLNAGFIPARKKNKLPRVTISVQYALEYGVDVIGIHVDSISPGENVLIVDDVIATGNTIFTLKKLVEHLKGKVIGVLSIIELAFLNPRNILSDVPICSLVSY